MITHSSNLAWRILTDRGAWRAILSPCGHKESDMTEQLSTCRVKGKNVTSLFVHIPSFTPKTTPVTGHLVSSLGFIFPNVHVCIYVYQFSSVTQSCPTLCNPMDCSTPDFSVYHQLLGFAQIHVHLVGDGIQPSYSLPSPSLPAFNLSQQQGLFQ